MSFLLLSKVKKLNFSESQKIGVNSPASFVELIFLYSILFSKSDE